MLTLEYLAACWNQSEAGLCPRREFAIGHQHFAFNSRPALMGDQLSPDSWYRESVASASKPRSAAAKSCANKGRHHRHRRRIHSCPPARADETTQKDKLIPLIRQLRAQNILVFG